MLSLPITTQVATEQYNIEHASESIQAVAELDQVFSPPHHGPTNIPIIAQNKTFGENYTHFPIVQTGKYAIFIATPGATVEEFVYPGSNQQSGTGTGIALTEVKLPSHDTPFFKAYFSSAPIIFAKDDPQPIAIKFKYSEGSTIQYIVSPVKDNV